MRAQLPPPAGATSLRGPGRVSPLLGRWQVVPEFWGNLGSGLRMWKRSNPAEAILGSVWFLCNRYTPYPNLYPDQSPSEDWTMEERFRPLTFHGLILRSQLVTLLVRGVCYSESQSVRLSSCPNQDFGRHEGGRHTALYFREERCTLGVRGQRAAVEGHA